MTKEEKKIIRLALQGLKEGTLDFMDVIGIIKFLIKE